MVVIAEVVRSGVVESRHHGRVVGLDAGGAVALLIGEPAEVAEPVYGRSSNKPMQAVAMLELGLVLPAEQLAVAIASHSGEPMHLQRVRAILAGHRLDESALDNTPDLPLDQAAAEAVLRAGGGRSSILQNCSGKHAAMVATCVVNGWPILGYLALDHPLQRAIGATIERLTSAPVAHVGVDGCGAPAHVLTLEGLARATAAIARAQPGTPEHAVAAAMRAHPELVGGDGRDVTELMRAIPGLVAKDGAEGVYVAAMPDGRAVAVKIDDGASRARPAVLVAALEALGIDIAPAARAAAQVAVLGHGRSVGTVTATVTTSRTSSGA